VRFLRYNTVLSQEPALTGDTIGGNDTMEATLSVEALAELIDTCLTNGVKLRVFDVAPTGRPPDWKDVQQAMSDGYLAALADVRTALSGSPGALECVMAEPPPPPPPEPESPTPLPGKRQISAKEFMLDVKAGYTNNQLMEKYRLSQLGLAGTFEKLMDAKVITEDELDRRVSLEEDLRVQSPTRQRPRCYPVAKLRISDLHNPSINGYVRDITAKGVQILGVAAHIGDMRSFRIQTAGIDDVYIFSFEAVCRWSQRWITTGSYSAGFEITQIDEGDLEQLKKMIEGMTICDL